MEGEEGLWVGISDRGEGEEGEDDVVVHLVKLGEDMERIVEARRSEKRKTALHLKQDLRSRASSTYPLLLPSSSAGKDQRHNHCTHQASTPCHSLPLQHPSIPPSWKILLTYTSLGISLSKSS